MQKRVFLFDFFKKFIKWLDIKIHKVFHNEIPYTDARLFEKMHDDFRNEILKHQGCSEVRCKGTILAIELKTKDERHYLNSSSENIADYFLTRGILLRPLGNVFYLIPPYCISEQELTYIYSTIIEFLNAYSEK